MVLAITGLMVAVCGPSAYAAAPGALDPSFSSDGRFYSADTSFVARAVAVDRENRIVVAGYSCDGSSDGLCQSTGNSSFRLVRLTRDGGLDNEFGKNGFAQQPIGDGRSQAFAVIQNANGTITAGGLARLNGRDVFALVRYLTNGTPDPSFGTNGVVLQPLGTTDAELTALQPSLDGSILAAGGAVDGEGVPRLAVAHFLADGRLDTDFGSGGYTMGGQSPFNFATSLAVGPSGSITAAGISAPSNNFGYYGFGEMRLDTAGKLVPGFDGHGSAAQRFASGLSLANAVIATPGNGFLAAGVTAQTPDSPPRIAIVRGTKAGQPDPSFGTDGLAVYPHVGDAQINSLIPYPDGRVLAIGQFARKRLFAFGQVRLLPNGRLDPTWGHNGVRRMVFPEFPYARATAAALTPGGRIVSVGVGCVGGKLSLSCQDGRAALLVTRQLGAAARDTTSPHMTLHGLPAKISARAMRRQGVHLSVDLSEPARIEVFAWRASTRVAHGALTKPTQHAHAHLRFRTHAGHIRIAIRAVDNAGNVTTRHFTLKVT